MTSQRPMPSVTLQDLEEFQARHFVQTEQEQTCHYSGMTATAFDEEDDGLGYYPDGVKRTLTDEQIKMFRHSEIQKLLRERRLKEPQVEIDKTESPSANEVSNDNIPENGAEGPSSTGIKDSSKRTDDLPQEQSANVKEKVTDSPQVSLDTGGLDYGESHTSSLVENPPRPVEPQHVPSRRIISYDD